MNYSIPFTEKVKSGTFRLALGRKQITKFVFSSHRLFPIFLIQLLWDTAKKLSTHLKKTLRRIIVNRWFSASGWRWRMRIQFQQVKKRRQFAIKGQKLEDLGIFSSQYAYWTPAEINIAKFIWKKELLTIMVQRTKILVNDSLLTVNGGYIWSWS